MSTIPLLTYLYSTGNGISEIQESSDFSPLPSLNPGLVKLIISSALSISKSRFPSGDS
jgi:hypothetical protein